MSPFVYGLKFYSEKVLRTFSIYCNCDSNKPDQTTFIHKQSHDIILAFLKVVEKFIEQMFLSIW